MSVLKKVVLLGAGAASLTKEKIEEAVEELVKRGEVAAGDRAKAVEELQQKAHAVTADIRKLIDEHLESMAKRFRLFDDLRGLQDQVKQLNKRLEELEKRLKGTDA